MSNYKTIAKNSILLYLRMAIVMVINLYTVRVVLNALGIEDYGIYNAVAGIITLLESVTSVLSSTTQRFYSACTGADRGEKLQKIFSASLIIFIALSVIVIFLGESIGLWFVSYKLVIPLDRYNAAIWIYQFSIVSFVGRLIQMPFFAATIAHEDMNYFAIINIAEYVIRLGCAFLIPYVGLDHLVYFGLYMSITSLLALLSYYVIAKRRYAECRFKSHHEKGIYKEMLSFSGWTLFGSVAGVGMNQVNTILTNLFFGPIVNASRAIALQINSAVNLFSSNIVLATRPQVTKSIADWDGTSALTIFRFSNKLIFYLILIIILPLFLEMDYVLYLWLGNSDKQMILFSRIILLYTLVMSIGNPITVLIQAIGCVKQYFVTVEIFTLLCPIATFVCFKMGLGAHWAFLIMLLSACCSHIIRIMCLKNNFTQFNIKEYLLDFIIPAFLILSITFVALLLIHISINNLFYRLITCFFVSFFLVAILSFYGGLSKSERKQVIIIFNRCREYILNR